MVAANSQLMCSFLGLASSTTKSLRFPQTTLLSISPRNLVVCVCASSSSSSDTVVTTRLRGTGNVRSLGNANAINHGMEMEDKPTRGESSELPGGLAWLEYSVNEKGKIVITKGDEHYVMGQPEENEVRALQDHANFPGGSLAFDLEKLKEIQSSSTAPLKQNMKELKFATENFSEKNFLGGGGFGEVYKGTLYNKVVAVKKLKPSLDKQSFLAEVNSLGRLHHKNLVELIGWCDENNEQLLVTEFMPNGSLAMHLFRNENVDVEDTALTWQIRHHILCGGAEAVNYLHNGCEVVVLHRDIKADNMLLDREFNARLGDFGLARVIQENGKTHHSTKGLGAGTHGYIAPESYRTSKVTTQTDVYAFGVLILETTCGRRPGVPWDKNYIVYWVRKNYEMDNLNSVVDSRINKDANMEQIKSVLKLGLACSHPNPWERPSMKTVLQVLKGEDLQKSSVRDQLSSGQSTLLKKGVEVNLLPCHDRT